MQLCCELAIGADDTAGDGPQWLPAVAGATALYRRCRPISGISALRMRSKKKNRKDEFCF
jgi:hypothetical protein